ncbi:BEM46 family protein [Kwoniella heveanensis BCC8398]|uniref:BEM46 family protein n=1 Tax=Kwoniella heveanensis BCC8398 TaxID=1296120 RepID=A0A1B9GZH7_9TREE|nr:BEM46 family protein [Kwoniella heveanensis BCC8398]
MISSSTALMIAKYAFGATITATTLAAGGLWFFQRHLIYPAYVPDGSRKHVPKPIELGMPYEDVTITCRDGTKIKGYVIPARLKPITTDEMRTMNTAERKDRVGKEMERWAEEMGDEKSIEYAKSRPTVVIFHANAGNMGHRVPLARKFSVDFGCNIFMLSYRGYGLSEGKPSEHGECTVLDPTAMQYILAHPILGETKIVLYGQSLGGAACLYAGSRYPDQITGIIVENTFFSLSTLIPLVLPQIPKFLLPILLTEHWDAQHTIPLIPSTTPFLMISGKQDDLVKPSQMISIRHLREQNGGRVQWFSLDGGHNDTCLQPGYWGIIGDWLKIEIEALYRPPPPPPPSEPSSVGEGSKGSVEQDEKNDSTETGSTTGSSSGNGEEDYHKITREEAMEVEAAEEGKKDV